VIPERFLPGAKALIGDAVGSFAGAGSVGEQPEGERPRQVLGVDGEIPGVGIGRRSRTPEQPAADAPLVLRLDAADVVAQVD
jgi:hypothetical protein